MAYGTTNNVWARQRTLEGNAIKQMLVPATERLELVGDANVGLSVRCPAGVWPAVVSPSQLDAGVFGLRLPFGATPGSRFRQGTWTGPTEAMTAEAVRLSWKDAFVFREENTEDDSEGLRTPQLGALHAILGYWTTQRREPATVVMPTGTGKTDTMLALLVAARLERLLVLVPSDALRTQIAEKFESLGVLQPLGVVAPSAQRPVVGQIHHGFTETSTAIEFARACNVVVATPAVLNKCDPVARTALLAEFSNLFIDEAHHVSASTWAQIRDDFANRPVVQFTATPFREDGRHLGGRLIYAYPLRQAQDRGYFSKIKYKSVIDFTDPDRALAVEALQVLRADLAAGLDHILMARSRSVTKAKALVSLYEELAPDLKPVLLWGSQPVREKRDALAELNSRASRVLLCVNMLGEGFDLPSLKVAAIHEPHKSLAVTLQFIGRFARVGGADDHLGAATVLVSKSDMDVDHRLRELYAEDAEWNFVLENISGVLVGDQEAASDFEVGFGSLPDAVSIRSLVPKMSTVVFRTSCGDWEPLAILDFFGEENLLTVPIGVNASERVAWAVVETRAPVRWGDIRTVEELSYELFVVYWDATHQLLYINSSSNSGVHQELAEAICGSSARRITGPSIYRVMGNLRRMIPTTVGVLDIRNRSRRFSFHVGSDVSEGFPTAEAQTKTQTNIFANGYRNGVRESIGASLKGRIWSYRVAETLKHWVDWCDVIGADVTDESISVDGVIASFIRPRVLEARPEAVCIAAEWPWELYLAATETQVSDDGSSWYPLIDADLRIQSFVTTGPIEVSIGIGPVQVTYALTIDGDRLTYAPAGDDVQLRHGRTAATLGEFLNEVGLILYFENELVIDRRGFVLQPNRELPPFEPSKLEVLDWSGINFRQEAQGPQRQQSSIQARVIKQLREETEWDLLIDDDGPGEVADIVAMREEDGRLAVVLAHCKYSVPPAGARIDDLYDLCGQAMKSAEWRRGEMSALFRTLERRARNKQQRTGVSPFEIGDPATLYRLQERSRYLRHHFDLVIAQPGLSAARVSPQQLNLLAATEIYSYEVAGGSLRVLCSG